MAPLTVSVVIPTRNRPSSLRRLLDALAAQDRVPDEVIIADASDEPVDASALVSAYPRLALSCFHIVPSLCAQRNRAIANAAGSHVLLCDDDIEPGPSYVRRLIEYLEADTRSGAVSGLVRAPDAVAGSTGGFSAPSFRRLMYRFVFQLGLGGDLSRVKAPLFLAPVLRLVQRWYRRHGNTWSLAGWPLVTNVTHPVVHSSAGVLGAALIRRDWLLRSPYDERLDRRDARGVGDHYGVALGFPVVEGIAVLTDLPVVHHRDAENRLDRATAYHQRVLALHYFMGRSARFSPANRVWLVWSLIGRTLEFLLDRQGDMARATARALGVILLRRNQLVEPALDIPARQRTAR